MNNRFGWYVVGSLLVVASNLCIAFALPQKQEPAPGLLEMSLAEAKQTDFFRFFHLEEAGQEKDATGRTVILFKPSGEAFHKLVTIRVTVNSEQRLVALESLLARSFINDRNQRVYANDLAKSTVLQGLSAADRETMQTLINEIDSNRGTDTAILTSREPEATPYKASDGYLTYLGKRYVYTRQLSSSALHMENIDVNGEPWLQIQLTFRANQPH